MEENNPTHEYRNDDSEKFLESHGRNYFIVTLVAIVVFVVALCIVVVGIASWLLQ